MSTEQLLRLAFSGLEFDRGGACGGFVSAEPDASVLLAPSPLAGCEAAGCVAAGVGVVAVSAE